MDAPHRYEMSLKKDGLFINLSSDDVYFVSKQMDKWFRILLDDSYVPVSLPKPAAVATSIPVAPVDEPAASVVAQASPPPAPVTPVAVSAVAPPSPVSEPPPEVTIPEPLAASLPPAPSAPALAVAVPQGASPALAAPVSSPDTSADTPMLEPAAAVPVSGPAELSVTATPPVEVPDALAQSDVPQADLPQPALSVVPPLASVQSPSTAPKDDFESVMDTVMRDLEAPPPPLPTTPVIETLYEQSPVSADRPMNLDLVNSLADLCDQAQPGSSEDYLLLAAYYLSQVESQACFSLKRINANLVKSGLTPVNHSALEAVLSKGYLSMVPDLSGTAEVSEYSMTDDGLAFVNQLF
ncbi:hypothetical protein EMOOHJMP_00081 [Microcystis phage MaAM05]|nr:hypothetical protein EMOOHJMP_00081 [Microcystis phage MaAM05]